MKKVLLAGEGRHELGGWHDEPPHREANPPCGVVEALARKVVPEGWRISDAVNWKRLPLYRAGGFRARETRRVLQLSLRAEERGFDAVVFTRDKDTGRDAEDREHAVLEGMDEARRLFPHAPRMAGGVAAPCIEGWVAAAVGVRGTEAMTTAATSRALADRGVLHTTAGMVEAVGQTKVEDHAPDASSLASWLERARWALTP